METFKKLNIVVAFLMVSVVIDGSIFVKGQVCNMSSEGLMACKPSVTPPNPTPPSGTCCSAISHADIRCLCSYKNSRVLPSLGIDPNLAMQLPDKCHLPRPAKC